MDDILIILIAMLVVSMAISAGILSRVFETDGARTTIAITGPIFWLTAIGGAVVIGVVL
jgi:hypothetical protein